MNPLVDRRRRIWRSFAGVAVGIAVMLVAAAGATAGVAPTQGRFAGTTSQHVTTNDITFRVSRSAIRNRLIAWRAQCRSGGTLTGTTLAPRRPIVNGRWSSGGSYDDALPQGITAHVTVVKDDANFTSPISAAGTWRVSVLVYRGGKKIDSCATGSITWAAGAFAIGSHSGVIVPRSERVGGLTYGQWEAKAWQWDDAHLQSFNSSSTPGASRCVTTGQRGPVWFLHGDSDASWFYVRSCKVPVGRYVFIDAPNVECSTVEPTPFRANTDQGLLRCVRKSRQGMSGVSLDGKVLSPSGLLVATSVFAFTMPPANNWLGVPGATSGRAAVYGQGLMIRPLSKGRHVLMRVTQYPGAPVAVTIYELTVG
jgi:hypothetical protein